MATDLNELANLDEDAQKGKFLTFSIGKETYGIEIRHVTEIVGIQPITAMPEAPAFIKGIINLRGKIIPVIDMRLKFKKEAATYNDRTCIVVIEIAGLSVGLIVDQVEEVATISDNDISPPPKTGFSNRFITGIGKTGSSVKLLLDCEKLLTQEEIDSIPEKAG